ncbi:MAG: TonB-dependent receptor [Steroidobacteraceae bacterium]
MKSNYRVYCAVAAILGAHAAAANAAAPAETSPAESEASLGISEVVVTATRREERLQDVPITVQAMTPETLHQLNVTTFEDAVKYLPNVTTSSLGPGQSNIYMRGLATPGGAVQGSGVVGPFPNVAVYLDDQSGQLPGRNLDIYAVDLERIEVLEGPQGTLFGAGAEAGVLRYITNKPKLNVTEANFNAGYAVTASGDPSTNIDATINLPLIADRLSVRASVYSDSRGGYIDNIPATFGRLPTDRVVVNYFGGVVPPNTGSINNTANAERNFNPVTYKGIRASGLYQINDDWNALLVQSYQDMDAEGVFFQEQYDAAGKTVPDLSVEMFNPSYNKDKFENTALTINGRIQELQFVYTGAYLDRNITQQLDYTNYSRGTYASYYQCNYPGYPFTTVGGKITPTPNSPGFCYSPSAYWTDFQTTTHQSHEMRLSTPADWRLRGLVGAFWENYTIHEQTDWHYGTSPNFQPIGPPTIDPATGELHPVTANNPNVRAAGDAFFDDITRGYKQTALFTSIDFDIIPKVLTITGGTRWYDTQNFELGSNVGSFGCEINGPYNGVVPPNPCISSPQNGVLSNFNNLDAKNLHKSYVGFKSRANLSWHVTPDDLLYYTWSQGFRPGGFNRAQSIIKPGSPLFGIFVPPLAFAPDTLVNNEIGWKTSWLDRRVQFNGAIYQEDWKDTQISIFDPGVTGNLTFTTNGPNYRVRGLEASIIGRVTEGLTVTAGASWNHSEVVQTLNLTNPSTGQPINIVNPFGALGTPLAQSPPFQGNIRARYEFNLADYGAFVQVGATHQSHSFSSTDQLTKTFQGQSVAFDQPAFTTYQASVGVSKDAWTAQFYGDNLSDTRATLFTSYTQFFKANSINRPRTLGVTVSYKFQETK